VKSKRLSQTKTEGSFLEPFFGVFFSKYLFKKIKLQIFALIIKQTTKTKDNKV